MLEYEQKNSRRRNKRSSRRKTLFARAYELGVIAGGSVFVQYVDERGCFWTYTNDDQKWNEYQNGGLKPANSGMEARCKVEENQYAIQSDHGSDDDNLSDANSDDENQQYPFNSTSAVTVSGSKSPANDQQMNTVVDGRSQLQPLSGISNLSNISELTGTMQSLTDQEMATVVDGPSQLQPVSEISNLSNISELNATIQSLTDEQAKLVDYSRRYQ